MSPKKKKTEPPQTESIEDELDSIVDKESLGKSYDQSNIPLLNKLHVLGKIPKWLQEYESACKNMIQSARRKILNEFLIEKAQELIDEYKSFLHSEQDDPSNPKAFRVDPLPIILGLKDDLTLLSYYQLAIESGEREGLALLANKDFSQNVIEGRKVVISRGNANRAKLKKLGNKKERDKIYSKWRYAIKSLAKELPYSNYNWTGLSDEVGSRFGVDSILCTVRSEPYNSSSFSRRMPTSLGLSSSLKSVPSSLNEPPVSTAK